MEESSPDKKSQLLDQLVKEDRERRRAEKELRSSYHLLSKTFEALLDAVFIIDADGEKIVRSNRAASETFGYIQEEMLGRATDFLHVDKASLEEFRRHLHVAVEKRGYLRHFQFRMRRKDGTVFPTEHSIMPLVHEQGDRFGWVSVVRDITERKQAEDALRESKQRFQRIVHDSEAGYFLVGRDGRWEDVNDAWLRMHGYSSREEVIGQHFSITQVDEDLSSAQKNVEKMLKGEAIPSGIFSRRCKDGSIAYHTFTAGPVIRNNVVVGLEGFIIDDTERRKSNVSSAMYQSLRSAES